MIRNLKKRVFYILFLFLIHFGLKAQTTSSVYNFNSGEYPSGLVRNNNGDFYYISGQQIKKITADGVVSTIPNLNGYITGFAIDSSDNIIYYNYNSHSFQKVSTDGTTSTFLSGFNYAFNLKFDTQGNLYFTAYDYNYNQSLTKVAPDGTMTSIVNGNVISFTFDYLGNLYYSNQNSIQKVTPEGSIFPYISTNFAESLSFDLSGNLYFLDNNSSHEIKKVTPNGNVQVYLANDSNLSNPSGLISDSTGVLYCINFDYNTYTAKLIKVSLSCSQPSTPIANDQSFEDVATVANLLAIGANIKWYATSTAVNALVSDAALTSGTYYVTQTVNDCESNRVPVIVTINKFGLGRYGEITSNASLKVTKNGAINAGASVNKYGKSIGGNYPNGLSATSAAASAYEIKQAYPDSPDGLYWLTNPNINGGTPFQIYADMTTDGGGWTLILCNNSNSGWNGSNAILRNETSPTINGQYSIIAYADYIKKSNSGFQYMIEATNRGSWGGIWTANGAYSFVHTSNDQTNITLNTKFNSWDYSENGIEQIMPWYASGSQGAITTSSSPDVMWWGTLVSTSGFSPAPWMECCNQHPGIIWYWVR